MSNSNLVTYTKLSPNHSGARTHSIDRITPHCVVGQLTAAGIASCFPAGRGASCNYGIGTAGDVALIVDEGNRSWCSSSNANDQRAVTIECASDKTEPYAFNNTVYNKLVELCVDICRRNGKTKLLWKNTDNYTPASNEMLLTVHRWYANKSCPGNWMFARMGDLAAQVTTKLSGSTGGSTGGSTSTSGLYRVRKSWADAKSQLGAYKVLANAQAVAKKNAGYSVFDSNGNVVGSTGGSTSTSKSIETIAREVIAGAWGNGDARKAKLTAAGYNYATVQAKVNELLGGANTSKKSIETIAREVIAGAWGNGQDRKNRLTSAGYDYNSVQVMVNKLLG